MKVSKSVGFLVLTTAICFAVGFLMGIYPHQVQKFVGAPTSELKILTSHPDLIPQEMIKAFEKETGIQVEVKTAESIHLFRFEGQSADLLLAPLSWMNSFRELLKDLPDSSQTQELIAADFQTLSLPSNLFVPALWTTENKDGKTRLLVWGFASFHENSQTKKLLKFLLGSEDQLLNWSKNTPFKFATELSNQSKNLPKNQRASEIREIPLSTLSIEDQMAQ
jgi:ABC-type glycerol-3-phosphate transport system substrate-binding protein